MYGRIVCVCCVSDGTEVKKVNVSVGKIDIKLFLKSWNNPAEFVFCYQAVHFANSHEIKHWHFFHVRKQVMAEHLRIFCPLLSLQISGSSRFCGLSGQCLWEQRHSPFPVSGCHVSLLVKVLTQEEKPQCLFVHVEAELLDITPRRCLFLLSHCFISLWFVKVAQMNTNGRVF